MDYCGRFAPSPSGRLHQGSLIAGYASLFRALSKQGDFIIRIEDLDFPRCPEANTEVILEELALLGMKRSHPPIIQGHQLKRYYEVLNKLIADGHAYYCKCTRADIKERPCPCKALNLASTIKSPQDAIKEHLAIRIDLKELLPHYPCFDDGNLGQVLQASLGYELADSLVLLRSDGIIAYNLAVVVDDYDEKMSEIVRGADMLDATFLQLCLYEVLGFKAPTFFHVPLITTQDGHKLSKQNKAPAVLASKLPHEALLETIKLLNQDLCSDAQKLVAKLNETAKSILALIAELKENLKEQGLDSTLNKLNNLSEASLFNGLLSYALKKSDLSYEKWTSLELIKEGKDLSDLPSFAKHGRNELDDLALPSKVGALLWQGIGNEPCDGAFDDCDSLAAKSATTLCCLYNEQMQALVKNIATSFKVHQMPKQAIVI